LRTHSSVSLACALGLALGLAGIGAPAARASFIDFAATPTGSTVSIGTQSLSGTVQGLSTATVIAGAPGFPSSMATPGTSLVFTTGSLVSTNAQGDMFFGPGGSIVLLSGSNSVLFSGAFTGTAAAPETELQPIVGGLYKLVTAGFAGQLVSSLTNFFGLSSGPDSAGALTLTLGVDNGSLVATSIDVTIDPNPAGVPSGAGTVPEPASIALIALGLPVAAYLGRRRRLARGAAR
jgi:hypothetical protein